MADRTHDPVKSAQLRRMPTGAIARTRLVVGIDLGTTNTALAWVDRQSGRMARAVRPFDIPQLADPGVVRPGRTLPSAVYVRGPHELSGAQVALPWDPEGTSPLIVGQLARQRGALTPDRLVTSAKSWLCHPGVDRRAAILPWGAPDDVQKRSPVELEATLLRHVRDAWNEAVARDDDKKRLERADVVVTVPASFDEVARELTVQTVRDAGLDDAVLIEEPTAALYAWIAAHEQEWPSVLAPGQTILVCDVGGGTTDLSLIRVTDYRPPAAPAPEDLVEPPGFERVAVGEHLLLGGDNMDLALARRVEERLGEKLDLRGWNGLVLACRDAKEKLLEGQADAVPIALAGRGARLIRGTLRTELTRAEVLEAVLEGFFPRVTADEPLPRRKVGLKELGLPYEPDPAITRHLRRFLARQGADGQLARVDHVLFNGGVFKTAALRQRALDVLAGWQERPGELEGSDLDLAVAHGAAYYGLVRRGKGTRIKSGAGRSYYLEVRAGGGERTALCLIPRGLEEGGVVTIADHPLEVRANTPVVFPFHTATGRDDAAGAILPVDPEQLDELAPLHTVIRAGKRTTGRLRTIPVELVARYTELGTLEIWLQEKGAADRRWRLELDTRPRDDAPGEGPAPALEEQGSQQRPGSTSARLHAVDRELPPDAYGVGAERGVDPERVDRARKHAASRFKKPASEARALEGLGKELEDILGGTRETWPVPVIRSLFDALVEGDQAARRRSPAHEARWLNLVGFCLRPGFGATLDFDRVGSMWKVFLEGPAHAGKEAVDLEWLVAFRRIAGGLKPGQQEALFSRIQAQLLGHKKADKQELAELWRLAASLELIPPKKKRQLGDLLVEQIEKDKAPPRWGPWALGRLGGRAPLYGPLDRLVPPDAAARWLTRLMGSGARGDEVAFACVQLARRTGDRSRDIPDDLRARARAWLEERRVDARTLRPLDEVVQTELRTQSDFYGDSVPIGLVLGGSAP